jgi:branched-chain amino acid transport system permease protein
MFYWAAVILIALAFTITVFILRSRFGYSLQAIREDEDAALACGIDATRTKREHHRVCGGGGAEPASPT